MTKIGKYVYVFLAFFLCNSIGLASEGSGIQTNRAHVVKFVKGVAAFDFSVCTNVESVVRQRYWFPRKSWIIQVNENGRKGKGSGRFEIAEDTLEIVYESGEESYMDIKEDGGEIEIIDSGSEELDVEKMDLFRQVALLMAEQRVYNLAVSSNGTVRVMLCGDGDSFLVKLPRDEYGFEIITDEFRLLINCGKRFEYVEGWYWIQRKQIHETTVRNARLRRRLKPIKTREFGVWSQDSRFIYWKDCC